MEDGLFGSDGRSARCMSRNLELAPTLLLGLDRLSVKPGVRSGGGVGDSEREMHSVVRWARSEHGLGQLSVEM